MKPKDAFGHYGCVPRNLHPAWFEVSWSARALGLALFALIDDFDTRSIDVHGDWRDSLCKRLAISGKERRYAKPALDALQAAGLVSVRSGLVTVNMRPTCADPAAIGLPAASDGTSKTSQYPETVQESSRQLAIKASKQREERAPAREARFEKPPIGEAPPNTPPSEPEVPQWLVVWQTAERMRGFQRGELGHPARHQPACQSIAAAVAARVGGSQGVTFASALESLLGAWLADPWVREKKPPMSHLANGLDKYASPVLSVAKVNPRDELPSTDEELLAWPADREWELDIHTKQRLWALQLKREKTEAPRPKGKYALMAEEIEARRAAQKAAVAS